MAICVGATPALALDPVTEGVLGPAVLTVLTAALDQVDGDSDMDLCGDIWPNVESAATDTGKSP